MPIPPPPEAQMDPDRLPWHLDEEAKAAAEIDRANYRGALEAMERELDAGVKGGAR